MNYYNEFLEDSISIDELKRKLRKLQIRGVCLFSMIGLWIPIMMLPSNMFDAFFVPGFVVAFIIAIPGMVLLGKSSILKSYIYGITVLQRVSPPNPIITETYTVLEYENTTVFVLRSAPYGLYFVAFKDSAVIPAEEIEVPKTFWKWDPILYIEGFRVHNRDGRFSIPSPDGNILSGEGILLLIPLRGQSYMVHYPDFSKEHLIAVAEYAAHLASGETSIDNPNSELS
jgi:hypothetical protein